MFSAAVSVNRSAVLGRSLSPILSFDEDEETETADLPSNWISPLNSRGLDSSGRSLTKEKHFFGEPDDGSTVPNDRPKSAVIDFASTYKNSAGSRDSVPHRGPDATYDALSTPAVGWNPSLGDHFPKLSTVSNQRSDNNSETSSQKRVTWGGPAVPLAVDAESANASSSEEDDSVLLFTSTNDKTKRFDFQGFGEGTPLNSEKSNSPLVSSPPHPRTFDTGSDKVSKFGARTSEDLSAEGNRMIELGAQALAARAEVLRSIDVHRSVSGGRLGMESAYGGADDDTSRQNNSNITFNGTTEEGPGSRYNYDEQPHKETREIRYDANYRTEPSNRGANRNHFDTFNSGGRTAPLPEDRFYSHNAYVPKSSYRPRIPSVFTQNFLDENPRSPDTAAMDRSNASGAAPGDKRMGPTSAGSVAANSRPQLMNDYNQYESNRLHNDAMMNRAFPSRNFPATGDRTLAGKGANNSDYNYFSNKRDQPSNAYSNMNTNNNNNNADSLNRGRVLQGPPPPALKSALRKDTSNKVANNALPTDDSNYYTYQPNIAKKGVGKHSDLRSVDFKHGNRRELLESFERGQRVSIPPKYPDGIYGRESSGSNSTNMYISSTSTATTLRNDNRLLMGNDIFRDEPTMRQNEHEEHPKYYSRYQSRLMDAAAKSTHDIRPPRPKYTTTTSSGSSVSTRDRNSSGKSLGEIKNGGFSPPLDRGRGMK